MQDIYIACGWPRFDPGILINSQISPVRISKQSGIAPKYHHVCPPKEKEKKKSFFSIQYNFNSVFKNVNYYTKLFLYNTKNKRPM